MYLSMDVLHKYLEFLWNSFQYDINVFSQGWIYYWALLPAAGYLVFFLLKWVVLTAPIWLPSTIIIRLFNLPSPRCEICVYKTLKEDFEDMRADKIQSDSKAKQGLSESILEP